MYENLDPAIQAQLDSGRIVWRDLLWMVPKDLVTGADAPVGFWTDYGLKTIPVIDALTQSVVNDRSFYGTGTLDSVDPLSLTADFSIREVVVGLSQVNSDVANAIRGFNVKYAPCQLYRGYMDPDTKIFLAPPVPRLVGIINTVEITDPTENSFGSIKCTLTSQMIELTRTNPDVRSDPSQQARNPGDRFYKDVATVGLWPQWWGKTKGKVA